MADHVVAVFERHLNEVGSPEDAREAVGDLIHELSDGPQGDLVVTHELYTLAARRPEYRDLTRKWMIRGRHLLERHFDAETARRLDALVEGLSLHRALDSAPHDRELTREAVRRVTAAP